MRSTSIDFERLFNEIEIGIFISDTEGNIISFNPKAKEIFISLFENTSRNELTSEISLIKLLIQAQKNFSTIDVADSSKAIYNRKVKFVNEKEEEFWFSLNSLPILNTNGDISEIFNTIIDITSDIFLEDSLKKAAQNIESVLYSISSDGEKYFFITEASRKIFGYNPEEILKNPIILLRQIDKRDFKRFKDFVRQLKKGIPSVVEYRIINKSGEQRCVKNSGFPFKQSDCLIKIDGVINDITKERKVQTELAESEQRFRTLIDTANDLIFNLDNYGYFLTVNTDGALSLGYKAEDMIGKHFLEFVDEENKADVAIAFQKILKSENINSFEAVLVNKSKGNLFFEIKARPIKKNNEITGMLGIGRNVSERRKVEEKLKELNTRLIEANRIISVERDRAKQQISILEEVNKLKSEFISNISHELRTPLASIVGFSETISAEPDISKEMLTEFNSIILSEGKRLARLINDFLDFAKIEAGKMDLVKSVFDISELVKELSDKAKLFADEKGVVFKTEIPEKEILLFADRERIGRVINQLLSNAIKFTNRNGRVSIIGQDFPKEFELIITDTGIGIAEQDLQKIFQKFFKVENPGTLNTGAGIGLGLAKQIVDLHRGLISVRSEVNKGTTFIVKLPKMVETKI
jgi:PAS domain S-box-containing protein